MKNVLCYLIGLCLALWMGGIVMLLIVLMSVFAADHALGAHVGPILFRVYEPYQLALAAIAIACTIAWRLYSCSRPKKVLMACLMGAAILAAVSKAVITPQIIALWEKRQMEMELVNVAAATNPDATTLPTVDPDGTDTARFRQLHSTSRGIYTGIAVLVLLSSGAFIRSVQSDCEFRPPKAMPK